MTTEPLYEAYLATNYVVYCPAPAVVRIGERCPAPLRTLLDPVSGSGCIITAWNPGSVVRTACQNLAANNDLARHRALQSRRCLLCSAVPRKPGWLPEDGFFVCDIGVDEARTLAAAFGQNAIVMVFRDRPAELVRTVLWQTADAMDGLCERRHEAG